MSRVRGSPRPGPAAELPPPSVRAALRHAPGPAAESAPSSGTGAGSGAMGGAVAARRPLHGRCAGVRAFVSNLRGGDRFAQPARRGRRAGHDGPGHRARGACGYNGRPVSPVQETGRPRFPGRAGHRTGLSLAFGLQDPLRSSQGAKPSAPLAARLRLQFCTGSDPRSGNGSGSLGF